MWDQYDEKHYNACYIAWINSNCQSCIKYDVCKYKDLVENKEFIINRMKNNKSMKCKYFYEDPSKHKFC